MDLIQQRWQVAASVPHVVYDLIPGQGLLPVLPRQHA